MSQRVLSDAQFASAVNADGASRRAVSRELPPDGGVFVSTPHHEKVIEGRDVTKEDVARHRAEVLKSPNADNVYQGGWPQGGDRYLDRSIRVQTPALAMGLGKAWNQEAVYDANEKRERFIKNPKDWPTRDRARVKR